METVNAILRALGGGERGGAAFVAFLFLAIVFALAIWS